MRDKDRTANMQHPENNSDPDKVKRAEIDNLIFDTSYGNLPSHATQHLSDSDYRELFFRAKEYLDYTRRTTIITDSEAADRAKLSTDLFINTVDKFLTALGMPDDDIQAFCNVRLEELAERLSILSTYYS